MPETKTHARFALALLAVFCLTPAGLLQAAPGDSLGPEFRVNTTIADDQRGPAIAMAPDGDFVVAWESCPVDVDGLIVREGCDILAQRFDAAGAPQGGEFLVNTTTGQAQILPEVAMDSEGYFVVVWWGYGPGGGYGIFGQRFDAAGVPLGPEFQVNTTETPTAQPSVAMDADGDFVVAWAASGSSTFAQRYNAAGEPQGGELALIAGASGYKSNYWPPPNPVVAMDAVGNFVVAFGNLGQIWGQRFAASGATQGDPFSIGGGHSTAVAMDADGDFVVVWKGRESSKQEYRVTGQHYSAAGEPTGSRFGLGEGYRPDVAMDADGASVVTWTGYATGPVWGVHGQRFSTGGLPQGGEIRVNLSPTATQMGPSIAMDTDGDFVATWVNWDGDGNGVFARRFDGFERIAGDFDGDGKEDLLWRSSTTGFNKVWLMDGESVVGGQSWGGVPTVWEIAGTGDFNGDGKADILWRNTADGNTIAWQLDGFERDARSIGAPPLVWTVEQIRDTNSDGFSDILWRNTETGGIVVWRMNGFTRLAVDPIGSVNSDWQMR